MTVPSELATAGPFTGNSVATSFDCGFRITAAADFYVIKRDTSTGIETTLSYDVDYTIDNLGSDTLNAVIQFPKSGSTHSVLSGTEQLNGALDMEFLQQVDLTNQGGWYPQVHEAVFDRLTRYTQQLKSKLARALTLPLSAAGTVSADIPEPSASKVLGFNASGTGIALYSFGDIGDITDAAGMPYTNSIPGAAATTVGAKLDGTVSVVDFGEIGTANDTLVIQAAINAAAASNREVVEIPAGEYLFTALTLKDRVVLRGKGAQNTILRQIGGTNAVAIKSENFDTYALMSQPTVDISGVTQASPGVVTATAHGLSNGDRVYITEVVGMTELNGESFVVANATTDTFELTDTDTSAYTAYTSGGVLRVPSDIWEVDEGMPSWLGFQDLQICGNRYDATYNPDGNTSGDTVNLYAKALIMNNVIIRDAAGNGLYSEGADKPGQNDDQDIGWRDLPEGSVGPLWIRNCGAYGWHMRGPHDVSVSQLVINECTLDGWRIERETGTYSGAADLGVGHIYANGGYGVYSNTSFRYRQLISESNGKEGVYLAGADQVQGSITQLYRNCTSSGTYNMVIDTLTEHCLFNHVLFRNPSSAGHGGIQLAGDHIVINSSQMYGDDAVSTGTAISVTSDAKYCRVGANIRRFNASGGVGLATNVGGAGQYNKFDVVVQDCDTLWSNGAVGNANEYSIRGYAESGQTAFTGSGPNTDDEDEIWDVSMRRDPIVATISGITQASPAVVTATAHGLANNDVVTITDVVGMTEVNGSKFLVANVTANTFELSGIDSSGFTAYSSGGTATQTAAIKSGSRQSSGAYLKTVDLNSTSVQDISIPHGLMATPEIEDCSYGLVYAGSNTTWELDYLILRSVDAVNMNFRVRLSTAAGAAVTGNIVAQAVL